MGQLFGSVGQVVGSGGLIVLEKMLNSFQKRTFFFSIKSILKIKMENNLGKRMCN